MLFSSYARLKFAKYVLYLVVDLAISYFVVRYLSDGVFEWAFFGKVYLLVLLAQLAFVMRDGLVNFVFMHVNGQMLVDGLVAEFKALGFPKEIVGFASSLDYLEAVRDDERMRTEARLGAAKYIALICSMQTSASGWINHQAYTRLMEKSIQQYSVKD